MVNVKKNQKQGEPGTITLKRSNAIIGRSNMQQNKIEGRLCQKLLLLLHTVLHTYILLILLYYENVQVMEEIRDYRKKKKKSANAPFLSGAVCVCVEDRVFCAS